MQKTDDWLRRFHQEVYLAFLDHYGVYLGTFTFPFFVVGLWFSGFEKWDIVGLSLAALWSLITVRRQARGQLDVMNSSARAWANSTVRRVILVLLLVTLPIMIAKEKWGDVIGTFPIVSWIYLMAAQVRDREPPETELKTAEQTN